MPGSLLLLAGCGTHFSTGPEGMTFEPLDHSVPPPAAEPKVSVLPHQESGDANYNAADFIRTSPDCTRGAVVEVLPVNDTTLVTTASAGYGGIAGVVIWPTARAASRTSHDLT
jgi:hypothetical protein